MTKYTVNFYTKIMIAFVVIIMAAFAFIIIKQSIIQKGYELISLALLPIGFLAYLCRQLYFVFREKFNQISIDFGGHKFYLSDKTNKVLEIPFEDVACVEVQRGEIIRGISLGQIRLHLSNGTCCKITVSNSGAFVAAISNTFVVDYKENIFFLPQ